MGRIYDFVPAAEAESPRVAGIGRHHEASVTNFLSREVPTIVVRPFRTEGRYELEPAIRVRHHDGTEAGTIRTVRCISTSYSETEWACRVMGRATDGSVFTFRLVTGGARNPEGGYVMAYPLDT